MSHAERSSLHSRAKALHSRVEANQRMMQTAVDAADPGGASNELDHLLEEFMSGQGSSQDRCPAKLLEAKHQLNELHKHMYSVAWEINATQTQLKIVTKNIEVLELEWQKGTKDCDDEKEKCETEHYEYKKQWEILIWELIEMKQIANPGIAITSADMSYAAWQSAVAHNWTQMTETSSTNFTEWQEEMESSGTGGVPDYDGTGAKPPWWPSLVQMENDNETAEPKSMAALMAKTKAASNDLSMCMQFFVAGANGSNGSQITLGQINASDSHRRRGVSSGSGSSTSESGSSDESSTSEESSTFSESSSHFQNASEECKAQLIAFEITYYKAYRQVTRLISRYEILVNSTSCIDEVTEECMDKEGEWSLKMETYRQRLEEYSAKMFHTKGHIEVMSKSEKKLQIHILQLSEACADMDETISDLDKVRDAIQVFDLCAGLGRPNFHIPMYTGETVTKVYDITEKDNAGIDADLNSWCHGIVFKGLKARAAETSEIMQRSIEGMPATNPRSAPLYGTCPHCNGDMDQPGGEQHPSGFFRNCWDGNVKLGGSTMHTDCGGESSKAVMCVVDRYDDLNNGTDSS